MSAEIEARYREHVSNFPVLADALDIVLQPGQLANDPPSELVRALCFGPATYFDTSEVPFADQLPYIMDHGLRQIALATTVFADSEIRSNLPDWLDLNLLYKAMLVADVGLAHVSTQEVELVHKFGPKFSLDYSRHPQYGYEMAHAKGIEDPAARFITSFIARHHMVQARNRYGLEWRSIDQQQIIPRRVDLMVLFQKPFDFFDDYIDRPGVRADTFEALVTYPMIKFVQSIGQLLCTDLLFASAVESEDLDLGLMRQICAKIQAEVLGTSAIGSVYRGLRPDLATV